MNEDNLMENWEQLKSDLSCLEYPDTPDDSDGSDTYDNSYEETDEGILVKRRGIYVKIDIYNKCYLALAFDLDIENFTLKISMKLKFVCPPNSISCVESSPTQSPLVGSKITKSGL